MFASRIFIHIYKKELRDFGFAYFIIPQNPTVLLHYSLNSGFMLIGCNNQVKDTARIPVSRL